MVEANDFLNKVRNSGVYKGAFERIINNNYDRDDYIEIYEYEMDDKIYEVVIHKKDNKYVNYYIKIKM